MRREDIDPPNMSRMPDRAYDAISRRFSNISDIRSYLTTKKELKLQERGMLTDIHDVSSMDPKDYDVLVTDISHHTLEYEISDTIGVPYLTPTTKFAANTEVKLAER